MSLNRVGFDERRKQSTPLSTCFRISVINAIFAANERFMRRISECKISNVVDRCLRRSHSKASSVIRRSHTVLSPAREIIRNLQAGGTSCQVFSRGDSPASSNSLFTTPSALGAVQHDRWIHSESTDRMSVCAR